MEDKEKLIVPLGAQTSPGWYVVEVKLWLAEVYAFIGKLKDMNKDIPEEFQKDENLLEMVRICQEAEREPYAESMSLGESHLIHLQGFRPFDGDDTVALMHESLHVAQKMLHHVGAEVSQERSETLAYTQQHVFALLFREFMKNSK